METNRRLARLSPFKSIFSSFLSSSISKRSKKETEGALGAFRRILNLSDSNEPSVHTDFFFSFFTRHLMTFDELAGPVLFVIQSRLQALVSLFNQTGSVPQSLGLKFCGVNSRHHGR